MMEDHLQKKISKKIPLVKICGNLYLEEALKVAQFEPDFMGWIFSPFSPRKIRISEAKKIILEIKNRYSKIYHVGVFAGNPISEILDILANMNLDVKCLDFLQVLEEDDTIPNLRSSLEGQNLKIPVIPVIRPKGILTEDIFRKTEPSLFWILDRFDPNLKGGTGKTIPEEFFKEKISKPYLIAGGIQPQNALKMIKISNAIGMDISSGVEKAPGIKDETKLKELFDKINQA
ncbi:MAG: phosphoribosylanthranilate isomerase [Leptonema sp. (in: bacteria)]